MGAQQKRPLRQLTPQEREELSQKATSTSERVSIVKKAQALLAVADGCTFTEAGRQVGMSRDGVSQLVERFQHRGMQVLSIASASFPRLSIPTVYQGVVSISRCVHYIWRETLITGCGPLLFRVAPTKDIFSSRQKRSPISYPTPVKQQG